jgi:4,5-DOPA dioxygenase extradiol
VYPSPGAPQLADRVAALSPDGEAVHRDETRRLDHGAYVPLTVMYPDADIPTLQISMPSLEPEYLLDMGRRLAELRDEGVLIIGSGFTTHGLPFLTDNRPDAPAPTWSSEFDAWAHERFVAGDLEGLLRFRTEAPGMPYAHPRIEHFSPLFVTLGAATDPETPPEEPIDGFWIGLAKRSIIAA